MEMYWVMKWFWTHVLLVGGGNADGQGNADQQAEGNDEFREHFDLTFDVGFYAVSATIGTTIEWRLVTPWAQFAMYRRRRRWWS